MDLRLNRDRWTKIQRTIETMRLFIPAMWTNLNRSSQIGQSSFKRTDLPNDASSGPLITMNR